MTITQRLEGRAKGFLADADHCDAKADACSDDRRKYDDLIHRAAGYRIAAEELLRFADEWRGTDNGG